MKKNRRAIIIAAAPAIAALFFFLPSLLGLGPVLRVVRWVAGGPLPGTLAVQSCSLGWWQGLDCEGVLYDDQALGFHLQAPRLVSDKGLFMLLLAPSYLGEVIVDQPVLTLLSPSAGSEHPSQSATTAGEAPADQVNRAQPSRWEHLAFRLKVRQGRIAFGQEVQAGRELVRELDLTASFALGSINYDLELRAGQQQGALRAKGFVNLPTKGGPLLQGLISRADIEITELQVADFLDFAAARGATPHGNGVLNATCSLNAAGIESLDLRGEATLRGVQLSGGFLGTDRPAVEQINFTFAGGHTAEEGWRLATLELRSDPLRLDASGALDKNTAALAVVGSLNLPAVAAQVPRLLFLKEKTTIKEGTVDFSVDVTGTPQALVLKTDWRNERLTMEKDGLPFTWDAPLTVQAEAKLDNGTISLPSLRAHTPFLEAQGSGGMDDFSLRATVNLARMFQELERFFAFDYLGKGQLELTASSRMAEDGSYRLTSRIAVDQLAMAYKKAILLPPHDFLLTFEAAAAPSFFQDGRLNSLRMAGEAWPGNISLVSGKIEPTDGAFRADCALQGGVDLERVSRFFQGFAGRPLAVAPKGQLSFAGTGQWAGQQLSLQSLNGAVDQLAVSGAGPVFHEPGVRLSLKNLALPETSPVAVRDLLVAENWQDLVEKEQPVLFVDFARTRLQLRHLRIETARSVANASLSMDDLRQPGRDFTVEVSAETDAAFLADLGKTVQWFAPDVTMEGRAQTTLKARAGDGQGVLTEMSLQVEPFAWFRAGKQLFVDPRLALNLSLVSDPGKPGVLKIPVLQLDSIPLQADATGVVQWSAVAPSMELQGGLTQDFAALAPLLSPVIGRQFVVSGKERGTFLFSSPLPLPADPMLLTFAAELPLDSLRYRGIELRRFTLPVDINRGRLRLDIAAQMEGGNVRLLPQWQLDSRPNVMTMPPSSQVLQGVPLDKPLIDDVLSRIHPLFGVLTEPEGTIDLRLDNFSWPLTAKDPQQADFAATVALGNIRLKAAKLLKQILEPGGLDHQALRFQEETLTCTSKRGRITCPTTPLMAGGHEITIGSDRVRPGSSRSFVHMPLTEQLAARVQLPWFPGLTARAEVLDTKKGPAFDQKVFLAGVTEQLRAAAAAAAAAAAVQPDPPVEKAEKPPESPGSPGREQPTATGREPEQIK